MYYDWLEIINFNTVLITYVNTKLNIARKKDNLKLYPFFMYYYLQY